MEYQEPKTTNKICWFHHKTQLQSINKPETSKTETHESYLIGEIITMLSSAYCINIMNIFRHQLQTSACNEMYFKWNYLCTCHEKQNAWRVLIILLLKWYRVCITDNNNLCRLLCIYLFDGEIIWFLDFSHRGTKFSLFLFSFFSYCIMKQKYQKLHQRPIFFNATMSNVLFLVLYLNVIPGTQQM